MALRAVPGSVGTAAGILAQASGVPSPRAATGVPARLPARSALGGGPSTVASSPGPGAGSPVGSQIVSAESSLSSILAGAASLLSVGSSVASMGSMGDPSTLAVDGGGNLVVAYPVLGLFPVDVTVNTEDLLSGKYGRSLTADLRRPGEAVISGDFSWHGIPVPVSGMAVAGLPPIPSVSTVQASLVADHVLRLQGQATAGLHWGATLGLAKVGNGVYRTTISNVSLFSSQVSIPDWLVRAATWIAAKLGKFPPGVQRNSDGTFTLDLNQVLGPASD